MTIDEAIKHCLEIAEENKELADKFDEWDEWEKADADNCRRCAADHRQLAEWLKELQELRVRVKKLEDENASLSSHACDLQLAYNNELVNGREAKRLLKLAVKDINFYVDCFEAQCDECCCDHDNRCHWKHEAEALKLIGGSENENNK